MSGLDKVQENRVRRAAQRQGLVLMKSRRRDQRAIDFGKYMLKNDITGAVVVGNSPRDYSLSLDQVEAYLNGT